MSGSKSIHVLVETIGCGAVLVQASPTSESHHSRVFGCTSAAAVHS